MCRKHGSKFAISSVLCQTYQNFELVIVNDGSKDKSADVVREFNDPRIIFIDNKNNAGVIARLNEGLALAKSEYIARLDSDDVWTDKDKLAKQIAFLDSNPEYGLLGTLGTAVNEKATMLYPLNYPTTNEEIRKKLLIKNCFINCSVIFRKNLLKSSGNYRKEDKHAEDYSLWLRLGRISKIANLPDRTVSYRVSAQGDSISNNIRSIQNCILLIKENRKYFPSYFLGLLKWNLKLLILKTIGIRNFTKLKTDLKK